LKTLDPDILNNCDVIIIEELQFFNDKEWNAIDSEIKDLIT
jgi:hypothetical protein